MRAARGWIALDTPDKAAALPQRSEWIVIQNGKSIAHLIGTSPHTPIQPAWAHSRDYLLHLETDATPPAQANEGRSFAGWCGPPRYLPQVLGSVEPPPASPSWHRDSTGSPDRRQLFSAFKKSLHGIALCFEGEALRRYAFGPNDLLITDAFRMADNRLLVAVTLKERYAACSDELGIAASPKWFRVDATTRYVGEDLSFVDAADYDGDGKLEWLFWYSGYNSDGYILFHEDFHSHVDFTWKYH